MWRLNRPSFCVQAARPVHFYKRIPGEKLPGRAVKNIEETIAIGPHHQLACAAIPGSIDQYGNLDSVVVVWIVRCELEKPLELARVGIECEDGIGVQVVAGPLRRIPIGARVAGSPIR